MTPSKRMIAVLLLALASSSVAGDEPKPVPGSQAAIYYSAAPWDGAAYDIEIPLEKSDTALNPFIRISIWGNPEYPKYQTIRFTGKEDSSGGAGSGVGRAVYQTIHDKSWPENLAGTIAFKSLQRGKLVSAAYDFTSEKGKKLKGKFKAVWGNEPPRMIR